MGALTELTYEKLYNAGFEIIKTATGIGATDLAVPMPAAGRGPLQLAPMTEALITGIFDGRADALHGFPDLGLEIPARDEHAYDIHRGLMQFRQNAKAEIEILGPEDQAAAGTDAAGQGRPERW
jgi:hypothetical protein